MDYDKLRKVNPADHENWMDEIDENPLLGYIKIFQEQHKRMLQTSRILIAAFLGFILLVSGAAVEAALNEALDSEIIVGLIVLEILLIGVVIQLFLALQRYKKKSRYTFDLIIETLNRDLGRLKKIQSNQAALAKAQNRIGGKFFPFDKDHLAPADYEGWDAKSCPDCHSKMEMTLDECPVCHHRFDEMHFS